MDLLISKVLEKIPEDRALWLSIAYLNENQGHRTEGSSVVNFEIGENFVKAKEKKELELKMTNAREKKIMAYLLGSKATISEECKLRKKKSKAYPIINFR